VESLISADELIGEGEAVHEATLLQPEDAAETALQRTLSAQILNHDDGPDQFSSQKACAKTVCKSIVNEWRQFDTCNESRHSVHDLRVPAREEDALHSCKGHQPLRKAV